MEISFFKVNPLAKDPVKATPGSAAFDIYSPFEFSLHPQERKMIDTGIIFNIPTGWSGLLFARSGLSSKYGICLSTGISLIDSDFRETLKVPLFFNMKVNSEVEMILAEHRFNEGDRIAQIAFLKLDQVGLIPTTVRETTNRGGFGSTGAQVYRHCNDCPEFFEGSNPPYYWSRVPPEHEGVWEDEDKYRCETCTKINQVTKLVSSLERDLISSKKILDGLIDDRDRKKAKK